MDTKDALDATQRSVGGGRYAVATLFLVGGVSTLTQIIAVASLGLPVTLEWSTGGFVAFIAAIWMWIKCRSWTSWRRWVWLPAVVTVVLAFVTIDLTVAAARQAAERQASEHTATCASAKTELTSKTATLEDLLDRTWTYSKSPLHRASDWRPTPGDGTNSRLRDAAEKAGIDLGPSSDEIWAFYASHGGPQLESDISQYAASYKSECGSE